MSFSLQAIGYKVYYIDARRCHFLGANESTALVVERTRGKARAYFTAHYGIPFVTKVSIKLLEDSADVYGKPGLVDDDDDFDYYD